MLYITKTCNNILQQSNGPQRTYISQYISVDTCETDCETDTSVQPGTGLHWYKRIESRVPAYWFSEEVDKMKLDEQTK